MKFSILTTRTPPPLLAGEYFVLGGGGSQGHNLVSLLQPLCVDPLNFFFFAEKPFNGWGLGSHLWEPEIRPLLWGPSCEDLAIPTGMGLLEQLTFSADPWRLPGTLGPGLGHHLGSIATPFSPSQPTKRHPPLVPTVAVKGRHSAALPSAPFRPDSALYLSPSCRAQVNSDPAPPWSRGRKKDDLVSGNQDP